MAGSLPCLTPRIALFGAFVKGRQSGSEAVDSAAIGLQASGRDGQGGGAAEPGGLYDGVLFVRWSSTIYSDMSSPTTTS
jgi:hypothetical protein